MEAPPSYARYLASQWLPQIVEKRFLRRPSVRLAAFVPIGQWLFDTGAVLGHARGEKAVALAEMFSQPGRASDVAGALREAGASLLEEFNAQPSTFFELWMARLATNLQFADPGEDAVVALLRSGSKRLSIEVASHECEFAVVEGVCVGLADPRLVERLWRDSYEESHTERRAEWRAHGLDIPERPQSVPLREREQVVLLEVATFAQAYYPHLLEALDLTLA